MPKWLKYTLMVVLMLPAGLVVSLLLAEALQQAIGSFAPDRQVSEPFAIPLHGGIHRVSQAKDLYWELVPNLRDLFQGVSVATNSRGFRDRDYGPRGAAARVVVLGDSITFGAAVEQNQSYPEVLETLLNRWRPAEVVNCGVSGYNLVQYLVNYERKARAYDPDLVIVGFFGDDLLPPYVPQEKSIWLWLELHSRLYQVIKFHLATVWPGRFSAQYFNVRQSTAAGFLRLEQQLNQWQAEGRQVLFVFHPELSDGQQPGASQVVTDVERVLAAHHVPYLELAAVYRAHGPLSSFSTNPPVANPHPNAAGHALIAAAIDESLRAHPDWLVRKAVKRQD